MPTVWFTLSVADNHWNDIHILLYNTRCLSPEIGFMNMNESQETAFRVKMILKFQNLDYEYFLTRAKTFLGCFVGSNEALNYMYY